MKFSAASILFVIALASSASGAKQAAPAPAKPATPAAAPAGYPPLDKPPPINQDFFRKVDFTKVPKIAVRKTLTDCAAGTGATTATNPSCAWSCGGCLAKTDVVTCPNKGEWALTYDDGPVKENTAQVLKAFETKKDKGWKGTFFVVGSRVQEGADTLKATFAAGHLIAVHTWSHTPLTTQSNEQIVAEILWTEKIINDTLGVVTKYMRPPNGDIDDRVRSILTQLGYIPVLWDLESGDSNAEDASYQADYALGNFTAWVNGEKTKPPTGGHNSLEHDIHPKAVAKIQGILDVVESGKYTSKTVAQCLNDPNPYQNIKGDGSTPQPTEAPKKEEPKPTGSGNSPAAVNSTNTPPPTTKTGAASSLAVSVSGLVGSAVLAALGASFGLL